MYEYLQQNIKYPDAPALCPMIDSSSSMKIVDGAWNLASSNRTFNAYSTLVPHSCMMHCAFLTRTNFSESPLHLLTMEEAEMLKKVVLHSVATAFASIVFPVPATISILVLCTHCKYLSKEPGGPYRSSPFHGARIPVKIWGYCRKSN